MKPNYKRAIESARALREEVTLNEMPINVRSIIEHLGILISEAPHDDDMSGLILKSGIKTLIGLNATHSENRKRFTLAHELGHHRLHDKGVFVDPEKNFFVKYRTKNHSFDPEEAEANAFAAELLMPEDMINIDFKNLRDNFKNLGFDGILDVLSKKYSVSTEAIKIRLDNLSLV